MIDIQAFAKELFKQVRSLRYVPAIEKSFRFVIDGEKDGRVYTEVEGDGFSVYIAYKKRFSTEVIEAYSLGTFQGTEPEFVMGDNMLGVSYLYRGTPSSAVWNEDLEKLDWALPEFTLRALNSDKHRRFYQDLHDHPDDIEGALKRCDLVVDVVDSSVMIGGIDYAYIDDEGDYELFYDRGCVLHVETPDEESFCNVPFHI